MNSAIYMNRLATLIRFAHAKSGYSQIELARRLGVSTKTLYNISCGDSCRAVALFVRLLQELDVPEASWLEYLQAALADAQEAEALVSGALDSDVLSTGVLPAADSTGAAGASALA